MTALGKSSLPFFRRVAASRIAHLLLVLNLCFIAYEFSLSPTRQHHQDECVMIAEERGADTSVSVSLLLTWVAAGWLLNLPAILLASIFYESLKIAFPLMCVYTATQIALIVLTLCASIQWMLVGYGIEKIVRSKFASTGEV